ncbi:MAG: T9SS type A sorting domain-containing protein [Flavobacteriales bacterium]|nr:T9SS type A sorting domain-containing protein [Flavobacteriales bacterium]
MKNLYLTFIALAFSGIAFSQNDTLLWEDFEAETIDYILNDYPNGDPNYHPNYLNFDVDGVPDGSGSDRPDEWFLSFGFADVDSTNTVLASNSWLQGEVDGAENWLITPRIFIQDNQATLYWKSAPFQLPRYLDGYQVLVSTETNVETDFTDTLAVFAEFDGNLTTNFEDTSTYVFTPGIMHTELEYDSTDVTRHGGVLQQWSASLADYAGESIFIAFRHRSDDDNLISIDDLLVLGTGTLGVSEAESLSDFNVYPNPSTRSMPLTLAYSLSSVSSVSYSITTLDGKEVLTGNGHTQLPGSHRTELDINQFSPGHYLVSLTVNDQTLVKRFVLTE